jgi:membrane associated rhomboid family serine protease
VSDRRLPRPVWTAALLAALAALAALQHAVGLEESIRAAGLVKRAVRSGEAWRLATAPFLHGGLAHVLMNGWALWNLGPVTEVVGHRSHLAIVFLASALAGSVASYRLMPTGVSVGASGGLMGLLGYLVVLGLRRRPLLPPRFLRSLGTSVLLMAAVGWAFRDVIDNAAHGGGLVAGMALGVALVPGRPVSLPLAPRTFVRLVGGVAAAATLVAALGTAWAVAGR